MGLDNGLTLCVLSTTKIPKWLKKLELSFVKNNCPYKEYEIFYWRKCYNLRQNISENLEHFKNNSYTYLSLKDLNIFKKEILYRYFTISGIKSWDSGEMYFWGYSLYRFKEGLSYLIRLIRLKRFLQNNDTCKMYFYDSY